MKKLLIPAALVALAACGASDSRGIGDAGVKSYDDTKAVVVNMPDQFSNVAFKCLGPNGIYVTTRQAAPVVVKDDPNCKKGAS